VPWSIFKFVLKHSKSTGDIIGYEGDLPFKEAAFQETPQKKDMTIKNIDSTIFQRVKTQAARRSMTVGDAINKAMEQWLESVDEDYIGNKKAGILRKLEKLSDKSVTIGMDKEIFDRTKKFYEQEFDKLSRQEEQETQENAEPY
jgi:hypothetical protein